MTPHDATETSELPPSAIAIVGMSVHAPGASDAQTLWERLVAGEILSEALSDASLRGAGVSERLLDNPRYVKRALRLAGVDRFEPEFFGLTPRDAPLMDPQVRHLFECSWEALEHAGVDPARPSGPIGLFVGAGANEYVLRNLLSNRELVESYGLDKLLQLGNDRDYLASRIAYALDLRGPTIGIGAACASGLLAVHAACQSLLGRECRIALAGGAAIQTPHGVGYLYEEGGLNAPDGVCRSFDANAQGTLPSSAAAVVTLMRLEDAVEEGRRIYAVILASAFNNDGRRKVGYAAPSVDGPLTAIEEALAVAGVDARSIGYVEAHGTATPFGDSIEVAALTKAFRQQTDDIGYCALGANKPNLGHTDAASGVISLIKAAFALATRTLPPLTNFTAPHPLLELPSSPFFVATEAAAWPEGENPRRALVNCLAVGGTNVHVVLEEPPPLASASASAKTKPELLVLSARSKEALAEQQRLLAQHLTAHPELPLRDVAFTLLRGRHLFDKRQTFVVSSREDAIAQLRGEHAQAVSAAPELVRLIDLARRIREERAPELGAELPRDGAQFVALPTYPFERRAFWLAPQSAEVRALPLPARDGPVPYARVVYREREPSQSAPVSGQRWLVFADETGFGEHLIELLRQHGAEVIVARLGNGPALTRLSSHEFRIDNDRGFEGPTELIAELGRERRLPDVILHLWTVTTEERFRTSTNRFHHDLERGYFASLAICQGLAELDLERPIRFVAVTNGAQRSRNERVLFPAKALVFGPLAAVPLEQTKLSTCTIDLDLPMGLARQFGLPFQLELAQREAAARVIAEAAGTRRGVFALRGPLLLAREHESIELPAQREQAPVLRAGATYVITGGFGNLGYAIALELARRERVKLVLVGRTPLPDRSYWDEWLASHPESDPVSRRIGLVRELETRGAEVLPAAADVCHLESMSSALTLARHRFGAIQGVVHAAGMLSEALAGSQSLDEVRDAIAPEVLGARVLSELLRRDKLDFFLLFGNAGRFAPRPGTSARIAASEFAAALRGRRRAAPLYVFDLGLVRDGGMFVRWARELEAQGPIGDPQVRALLEDITRGLGTETTARAVVDALLRGVRELVIGPLPEPGGPIAVAALSRSELKREYVAPEGDIERKLAAIWAEALHIDRVGATDDFFELGGHSVIAVRLGARIKATWGVAVPLALIIEAPTVRKLGKIIADHLAHRGRGDTVQVLREWTTIVPLQPHGERPPLFCVGGKGGNVMNLRHLATLLGRDQPVFGLQARGVDGVQKPHDTFEGMVQEYLNDVQRIRPSGPYFLSGFSGGGAIILEIARRLRAQGHVVAPLLFFDAWNPAARGRTLPEKLRAHAALFQELGPSYAGIFARRFANERAKSLLRAHAPTLADRIWEAPPMMAEVAGAWENAAAEYQPSSYEGDAVLFRVRVDRSRGELDFSDDEQNGWGEIVLGGVDVIDVPGTHTSLVEEPHVRTLAQGVRTVLDHALRTFADEPTRGSDPRSEASPKKARRGTSEPEPQDELRAEPGNKGRGPFNAA